MWNNDNHYKLPKMSASTIQMAKGLYVLSVLPDKKVVSPYLQSDAAAHIRGAVDVAQDL